jgi:hypothetical protein
MESFKELYKFLQGYELVDILSWLKRTMGRKKTNKNPLLRLFSGLSY